MNAGWAIRSRRTTPGDVAEREIPLALLLEERGRADRINGISQDIDVLNAVPFVMPPVCFSSPVIV